MSDANASMPTLLPLTTVSTIRPSILAATLVFLALVAAVPALVATALFVPLANPVFLNKIDRLTAGVVSPAMLGPVLLVPWWHIQLNRLPIDGDRGLNDYHRLRVNNAGLRKFANVDAAIDTGLMDANRNPDAGLGDSRRQGTHAKCQQQKSFHRATPKVCLPDPAAHGLAQKQTSPMGGWSTPPQPLSSGPNNRAASGGGRPPLAENLIMVVTSMTCAMSVGAIAVQAHDVNQRSDLSP